MLNLKRWWPVEYEDGPTKISMELKRARFDEATPILVAFADAYEAYATVGKDAKPYEINQALVRFYDLLPKAKVEDAFRGSVRNVKVTHNGEPVLLEGEPIVTGEQLYEVADHSCVLFVLTQLRDGAGLSVTEGKVSDSPALSPEIARPESSASPAESIGQEAGPAH